MTSRPSLAKSQAATPPSGSTSRTPSSSGSGCSVVSPADWDGAVDVVVSTLDVVTVSVSSSGSAEVGSSVVVVAAAAT